MDMVTKQVSAWLHLWLVCCLNVNHYNLQLAGIGSPINYKPQYMCEGYGSHFVCVSITAQAATYLVDMSKVRRYTVSCLPIITYGMTLIVAS